MALTNNEEWTPDLRGTVLTDEEKRWILDLLESEAELYRLDCVDNRRAADADDPEDVTRYQTQKDRGCCGFYDKVVSHPVTGRRIMYGCNHGH